jgi:ribose transport system permease protein
VTASRLRRVLAARETGVFIALVLMCLLLAIARPNIFPTAQNLLNIGRQVSLIGIMAVGMTFVIISGEIDLSIGSTYALSGLSTGLLLTQGWALLPALLVGLLVGASVGFINGFLSTFGRLPSFITTLGMMSVARGIALLLTQGQPVTVRESFGVQPMVLEQFKFIGQGQFAGLLPMQLFFFIIIAVFGYILLARTIFGFQVYAVGGSQKAARVSGIKVFRVKILAMTMMGLLSAFSGILVLAFLLSGQAGQTGSGLELDVIAAVIVGGAALSGGEGSILGTVLGVLIIGVLRNGLVLLQISPYWQTTIIGLVIVLAVGIDKWTRGRRTR